MTAGPLARVREILSIYRPFVDEIVCAVHAGLTPSELSVLTPLVDRLLPCEMRQDFLQERYRPWLYAQCSGEWIISTDSDEVPSRAFLDALARLTEMRHVVTYAALCRWLYPDGDHYLDEYPWEPAWKLALVRNDPATLYLRGGVHEGVVLTPPYRYLEQPIYHLDCVLTDYVSRKAKAGFYTSLDGIQQMEDGRSINEVYYLPEEHSRFPQQPLPLEDAELVRRVLAASSVHDRVLDRVDSTTMPNPTSTVGLAEILAHWDGHEFEPTAYQAKVDLLGVGRTTARDQYRFATGEIRPQLAVVENLGNEAWLRDGRNEIRLASRWRALSSDSLTQQVIEGARFPFPADVLPGERVVHAFELQAPTVPGTYRLQIDLVHEHVRWFGAGVDLTVTVGS
jgi:hypothetical protein